MITDSLVAFFTGFIIWLTSPLPVSTWGPVVPVLPLLVTEAATALGTMDYYMPLSELVAVAGLSITIRLALMTLWIAGWIYARIPFKGT